MDAATVNWTDLREFRAVDLTRSFVLSWEYEANSLLIDLDLALSPEHAFYEEPRPAETACFRPALLEFPHCTQLADLASRDVPDEENVVVNLGHGRITAFKLVAEGEYVLSGDFGKVKIFAERPLLRLKGQIV